LSPAGQPGPPLGFGRSAEIYDLGRGRVLRRYRDRSRLAQPEAAELGAITPAPTPQE
jgi:hypothetical protein